MTLAGCQFHKNKEVEMVIRERLRMQNPLFLPLESHKTRAKMGQMHRCAQGLCFKNNEKFGGISEVH
jgi:hypothetical protein